jgi:hypothetical protein
MTLIGWLGYAACAHAAAAATASAVAQAKRGDEDMMSPVL